MPLPTVITDLSTTAASNFPQGSDSPSSLDDVQRAHASFIAQIRDGVVAVAGTGLTGTAAALSIGGTAASATTAGTVTGQTATGTSLIQAASAAAARTALGSTTVGDSVFIAASQSAAQTAIGVTPSSSTPLIESGAGAVGTATTYARGDHVHPASATLPITYFTTPSALSVSVVQSIAHGLGAVPTYLSAKLLVITAGGGGSSWPVGAVIDGLGNAVGGVGNQNLTVGADATNIYVCSSGASSIVVVDNASGFGNVSIPIGNFKVIVGVK